MARSPTYWAEINKFCGELLDGVPPERENFPFFLYASVWRAKWNAEDPGTAATLEKAAYTGGALLLSWRGLRRTTAYALHLRSLMPETGDYRILFDPQLETIGDARNMPKYQVPHESGISTRIRYVLGYEQTKREQECMGLDLPGPEDYDLLWSELQRGAKQQR